MYFKFTFRVRGKFRREALSRRRHFLAALEEFRANFEETVDEYWEGDENILGLFPTASRVEFKQVGEPHFTFKRNLTFSYEVDYAIIVRGRAATLEARVTYSQIRPQLQQIFDHITRAMEFDDFLNDERYFRPLNSNGTHRGNQSYTQNTDEFPYVSIEFPDPFIAATRKNIKAREMERLLQGIQELPPGVSRIIAEQVAGPMRRNNAPRSRPIPTALSRSTLFVPHETRVGLAEASRIPPAAAPAAVAAPSPASPSPPRSRWSRFKHLFQRRNQTMRNPPRRERKTRLQILLGPSRGRTARVHPAPRGNRRSTRRQN